MPTTPTIRALAQAAQKARSLTSLLEHGDAVLGEDTGFDSSVAEVLAQLAVSQPLLADLAGLLDQARELDESRSDALAGDEGDETDWDVVNELEDRAVGLLGRIAVIDRKSDLGV